MSITILPNKNEILELLNTEKNQYIEYTIRRISSYMLAVKYWKIIENIPTICINIEYRKDIFQETFEYVSKNLKTGGWKVEVGEPFKEERGDYFQVSLTIT